MQKPFVFCIHLLFLFFLSISLILFLWTFYVTTRDRFWPQITLLYSDHKQGVRKFRHCIECRNNKPFPQESQTCICILQLLLHSACLDAVYFNLNDVKWLMAVFHSTDCLAKKENEIYQAFLIHNSISWMLAEANIPLFISRILSRSPFFLLKYFIVFFSKIYNFYSNLCIETNLFFLFYYKK